MNAYSHIRNLAIRLRKAGMSLDDIVGKTHMKRGTIAYWIRGMPLLKRKPYKQSHAQRLASASVARKAKTKRDLWHKKGMAFFKSNKNDSLVNDFTMLYLTEGYRKAKNHANIINSDPALIALAERGFRLLKERAGITCSERREIRIYADNNVKSAVSFWSQTTGRGRSLFSVTQKKSGGMRGRTMASKNGCLSISMFSTSMKSLIDGMCDAKRQLLGP